MPVAPISPKTRVQTARALTSAANTMITAADKLTTGNPRIGGIMLGKAATAMQSATPVLRSIYPQRPELAGSLEEAASGARALKARVLNDVVPYRYSADDGEAVRGWVETARFASSQLARSAAPAPDAPAAARPVPPSATVMWITGKAGASKGELRLASVDPQATSGLVSTTMRGKVMVVPGQGPSPIELPTSRMVTPGMPIPAELARAFGGFQDAVAGVDLTRWTAVDEASTGMNTGEVFLALGSGVDKTYMTPRAGAGKDVQALIRKSNSLHTAMLRHGVDPYAPPAA